MALLGPLSYGTSLERLQAAGEVQSAEATLDDLPEPLALEPCREPPSAVLARLRRDER